MIGWVRPKTTQTGLRSRMRICRWKTRKVSVAMAPPYAWAGSDMASPSRRRPSGQGQEDVVERRAADAHGGRRAGRRRRAPAAAGRRATAPSSTVTWSVPSAAASSRTASASRAIASARSSSSGSVQRELDDVAGDARLQRRRGVVGDEPAVVHDEDPVGQRVGLLEVVRGEEDRHAGRRAGRGCAPTGSRGSAGRARWSARRGRRAAGRASGRARCRSGGAGRPRARAARAARGRRGRAAARSRPAARRRRPSRAPAGGPA